MATDRRSHIIADAITMLRRNLLRIVRQPGPSMSTIVGLVGAVPAACACADSCSCSAHPWGPPVRRLPGRRSHA